MKPEAREFLRAAAADPDRSDLKRCAAIVDASRLLGKGYDAIREETGIPPDDFEDLMQAIENAEANE